jgi:capsular polysaccharide biosynthesis protein
VEIDSYLGVILRRLWILILVPLLAAGAVIVWEFLQPAKYQATATIAAPAVVGGSGANTTTQYSGANAPKAFVADFSGAVTSPLILNQVAEKTGAAPGAIKDGLTVSQIGDSSLLQVGYTTSNRDEAAAVLNEAASATIRFLFQTQVTLAEKMVAEARRGVERVNAEQAAFYRKTGQVLPDEAYRIRAQQLADLQRDQVSARSRGEYSQATALESAISAQEQKVAELAPLVATYQSLVERRTQALGRLNVLEEGLERAQAQYSAADPKTVVTMGEVQQAPLLPRLVKKGAPAFGAGLFLAVGIVLLLQLGSRRAPYAASPRRARGARSASDYPDYPDYPEHPEYLHTRT